MSDRSADYSTDSVLSLHLFFHVMGATPIMDLKHLGFQ
jgi:hypothetical protein